MPSNDRSIGRVQVVVVPSCCLSIRVDWWMMVAMAMMVAVGGDADSTMDGEAGDGRSNDAWLLLLFRISLWLWLLLEVLVAFLSCLVALS